VEQIRFGKYHYIRSKNLLYQISKLVVLTCLICVGLAELQFLTKTPLHTHIHTKPRSWF